MYVRMYTFLYAHTRILIRTYEYAHVRILIRTYTYLYTHIMNVFWLTDI